MNLVYRKIDPTPMVIILLVLIFNEAYNRYAKEIFSSQSKNFKQILLVKLLTTVMLCDLELSEHLSEIIQERTPFYVRYAGLTDVEYPTIITDAQENAAERREKIQQERPS